MMAASKLIPALFLALGVFILLQVLLPILSFKLWVAENSQGFLISPKPSQSQSVLGVSIKNQDNFPSFISSLKRETAAPYQEFSLFVPSIKLNNMAVAVDSNDLSKGLVHLPGSALPGERGNVFISGHSSLSGLLPGLKTAPFAKLTDIKKGDKLTVVANDTKFVYQVVELKIVDPSDLSVIVPAEPLGRYISLMTCVPPGLNFKRLIVLGKMI